MPALKPLGGLAGGGLPTLGPHTTTTTTNSSSTTSSHSSSVNHSMMTSSMQSRSGRRPVAGSRMPALPPHPAPVLPSYGSSQEDVPPAEGRGHGTLAPLGRAPLPRMESLEAPAAATSSTRLGHGSMGMAAGGGGGTLGPRGGRAPLAPASTMSSQSGPGLKLAVLESIDAREQAIAQLRDVILRWPRGGAAWRTPTALAALGDCVRAVRRCGVVCVRLLQKVAVATGSTQFLWNGQNYVSKMCADLDFVQDMLSGEGADWFTVSDPFLCGKQWCFAAVGGDGVAPAALAVTAEDDFGPTDLQMLIEFVLSSGSSRNSSGYAQDIRQPQQTASADSSPAKPKRGKLLALVGRKSVDHGVIQMADLAPTMPTVSGAGPLSPIAPTSTTSHAPRRPTAGGHASNTPQRPAAAVAPEHPHELEPLGAAVKQRREERFHDPQSIGSSSGSLGKSLGKTPRRASDVQRFSSLLAQIASLHHLSALPSDIVGAILNELSSILPSRFANAVHGVMASQDNAAAARLTTGLVAVFSHLVQPSLDAVEKAIQAMDPEDSWTATTTAAMEDTASTAVINTVGSGDSSVLLVLATAIDVAARAVHRKRLTTSTRPVEFNRVLRMLFAVAWRGDAVGVDARSGVPADMPPRLLRIWGVSIGPDTVGNSLLDGATKLLLLHRPLAHALGEGAAPRRVAIGVERAAMLESSMAALAAAKVGQFGSLPTDTPHNGSAVILAPYLMRVGPSREVEEGEGHGPRREVVFGVGQAMIDEWAPVVGLTPTVSGNAGADVVRGVSVSQAPVGSRLLVGPNSVVLDVVGRSGEDAVRIKPALVATLSSEPCVVQRPQSPLFVFHKPTESWWPNSALTHNAAHAAKFEYVGWLIAACMLNRTQLPFRVSPLFVSFIMSAELGPPIGTMSEESWVDPWAAYHPNLSDIRQYDEQIFQTVSNLMALDDAGFQAVLEAEGAEPDTTKSEYFAGMVDEVLLAPIEWHLRSLRAGFNAALGTAGRDVLRSFRVDAADICDMISYVEPESAIDVISRFVLRVDDSDPSIRMVVSALRDTVSSWTLAQQRRFLEFVTGVDRIPAPGSEVLTLSFPHMAFGLKDHRRFFHTLPTAHTCFNNLELPNYAECVQALIECGEFKSSGDLQEDVTHLLDERLTSAITMVGGYGLDEAVQARTGHPLSTVSSVGERPHTASSVESLDIPMIE